MCNEVMQCPLTPEEWKEVADRFSKRWYFHDTIGAIDGKHVAIYCPHNAGSLYYKNLSGLLVTSCSRRA
ncbi:hypothetical protein HOLleu_41092 [Holothuria leucospilota]|uniref:DDE Tnp4 domain-containing protein n=1 Tax=Holothuria leucospilota TaxID=206669 RepID=A0A9Q1B9H0_HOLLE|nr:hypothetical protein HOLleu_41092 [Holothuria leucospilota]